MAATYKSYWDRLKADTHPPGANGKAQQSPEFRKENEETIPTIPLEDGSGTVDLWFSPNTDKARSKTHGPNEAVPPDLAEVFGIISKAQQAILFLAFEPGSPSIIDAIAKALKTKPSLFVRGAVTAPAASGEFYTRSMGAGGPTPPNNHKANPPPPKHYV